LKHDTITDEAQEAAALYALGALCQQDARAFELHLEDGCLVCQREKQSFDRVVAGIGSGAGAVDPPAHLRQALSERISRERQRPRPVTASARVAPLPERPIRKPVQPARASVALPWAIAAFLAIAFAGSFLWWQSRHDQLVAESRNQIQAALEQAEKMRAERDQKDERMKEQLAINQVLSSPGSKMIDLSGESVAPSASGRIYWDVKTGQWIVTAQLPVAPAGKTYQLWFVTADAKISAGLIKPDESGHGFAQMKYPPNVSSLIAAAITLEPEGGSAQPTMPIYAIGKTT